MLKEPSELKELKVDKDSKVHKGLKELLDPKVLRVVRVSKVHRELKVQ